MRNGLLTASCAALALAGFVFGYARLAAPSEATPARPAQARGSAAPFLSAGDCFGKSYEAWIGAIRAKNSAFNPKALLLPVIFPRGQYESAQRRLDCRSIAYESDGVVVYGWMLRPKEAPQGKLPVVVFNRGGNGGFGALKFADLFRHLIPLADQGFLVLASQYRGLAEEPGTPGADQFGGADVGDVRRLMAMIPQIPQADANNVFLLGVSRGVMQSYLVARHEPGIRAMVMVNGSVDLQADLAVRPEMVELYRARIPGYAGHETERLRERSALYWAEELPPHAPILLMHGSEDPRVPPMNGPKMKQRLDALQRPSRLIVYEGVDHFIRPELVVAEATAWFRANLGR